MPDAVPTLTKPRRTRALIALGVLAVLVAAGGGAALLVPRDEEKRPADEEIAAAAEAAADATSFRFEVRITNRTVDGETETTGSGEWPNGITHSATETDGAGPEFILTADGSFYNRSIDADDETPDRWDRHDVGLRPGRPDLVEQVRKLGQAVTEEEGRADDMAVDVAAMLYLSGEDATGVAEHLDIGPFGPFLDGSPAAFLDAIRSLSSPLFDGDTIVATLKTPQAMVEAFGQPIPDGEVSVDLGTDGLPTTMRLEVEAGQRSATLELAFSDWNTPVEIALPGGVEVDPTPYVEEEAIRAVDVALVAPTPAPDVQGPTSVFAMDLAGRSNGARDDCDLVDVSYDIPPQGYVALMEMTLDCALAVDDSPFAPGGLGGHPSRTTEAGLLQVRVGDTVVEVEGTLRESALDALLRTLTPVDVETLIERAAGTT